MRQIGFEVYSIGAPAPNELLIKVCVLSLAEKRIVAHSETLAGTCCRPCRWRKARQARMKRDVALESEHQSNSPYCKKSIFLFITRKSRTTPPPFQSRPTLARYP